MARIRYLDPEFFLDEELAKLGALDRIAFSGLWCHSDRCGFLECRPERLKALILPYDKCDFLSILNNLAEHEFIEIWDFENKQYIKINNFLKYQKPHHTERESTIQPIYNRYLTVKEPLSNALKDKDKDKDKGVEQTARTQSDKVILSFPTNGKVKEWWLDEKLYNTLKECYPNVNCDVEIKKAQAWCITNSKKRKTISGMPKFLNSWFSKSQNNPSFKSESKFKVMG